MPKYRAYFLNSQQLEIVFDASDKKAAEAYAVSIDPPLRKAMDAMGWMPMEEIELYEIEELED